MFPQIDFKHVLTELSVNRNDPCEVIRELISNSYDAGAANMRLATIPEGNSFIFWDDGKGLSRTQGPSGISPYEAFHSIGKSTKKKGDGGIGYKCQGSKLCFASTRVLLITKTVDDESFYFRITENPRDNLSTTTDISPHPTSTPWQILQDFFSGTSAETSTVIAQFDSQFFSTEFGRGTLIAVRGFDTDNFAKYFLAGSDLQHSYVYNYIRHFTRHGDTRKITKAQGFKTAQIHQIENLVREAALSVWNGASFKPVPFGFNYLRAEKEGDIKGPLEVARLRDGRYSTRAAKRISFGNSTYCFLLAVDGNRRAHDGYEALDRKGATKSGIRLSDQRGVWISSSGIKICRINEILLRPELEDYSVLADSEGVNHYHLIIDGDFELVTNRNNVSRSASIVLENTSFTAELKKFLDSVVQGDNTFRDLLKRLRREHSEAKLSQQIDILRESKDAMSTRERFIIDGLIYVSPLPGEEYLVGVLYAELGGKVPANSAKKDFWKRVLTFSTQGIDSLASTNPKSFKKDDLRAVEYKYLFSNSGPFNHALCLVDMIVAWDVDLDVSKQVKDEYGCYGSVSKTQTGIWEIRDINHVDGDSYGDRVVTVICLKQLIRDTFQTSFSKPN